MNNQKLEEAEERLQKFMERKHLIAEATSLFSQLDPDIEKLTDAVKQIADGMIQELPFPIRPEDILVNVSQLMSIMVEKNYPTYVISGMFGMFCMEMIERIRS